MSIFRSVIEAGDRSLQFLSKKEIMGFLVEIQEDFNLNFNKWCTVFSSGILELYLPILSTYLVLFLL